MFPRSNSALNSSSNTVATLFMKEVKLADSLTEKEIEHVRKFTPHSYANWKKALQKIQFGSSVILKDAHEGGTHVLKAVVQRDAKSSTPYVFQSNSHWKQVAGTLRGEENELTPERLASQLIFILVPHGSNKSKRKGKGDKGQQFSKKKKKKKAESDSDGEYCGEQRSGSETSDSEEEKSKADQRRYQCLPSVPIDSVFILSISCLCSFNLSCSLSLTHRVCVSLSYVCMRCFFLALNAVFLFFWILTSTS